MTAQSTGHQWYIARDGKQTGPISDIEINVIAARGYFRDKDLVWRPGFAEWQPALTVFPPQLAPPPPPPPPVPAVPVSTPEPVQTAAGSMPDAPASASAPAAAAARSEPSTGRSQARSPGSLSPEARSPEAPVQQQPAAARTEAGPTPAAAVAPRPEPAQARQPAAAAPAQPAAAVAPIQAAPMQRAGPVQNPPGGGEPSTAPPRRTGAAQWDWPDTTGQTGRDTPTSTVPASALPGARPFEPAPLRPLHMPAPSSEPPQRLPLNLPRGSETSQRPTQPRFDGASTARPGEQAVQRLDLAPEPEELGPPPRTHRMAMAALLITLSTIAGAIWVVAQPNILAALPDFGAMTKSVASLGSAGGSETQIAAIDANWQKTVHWPVIKREFPDWYGDRLREAAKLKAEKKPEREIAKILVDEMVALRRQNALQALSASTPKLVALASAFLDNLKQLKSLSTAQCFSFISQGEATPGVIDLLQVADGDPPSMQRQVAAIFDAIGEGRKSPVTHDKPQKGDYDALMGELGKLGWTQADVATFADPRALARAEPARVCQMVQDWFVAHISLSDQGTQERLLGETLRPVVNG